MVSNRQITLSERWSNFQFLYNWLATTHGDILFDEKCHGSTKGINVIFYFLHGPTGLVALQLILILIVGVVSAHQRFGAILAIKNNRRISNLEHIEGLSNTYQRAGARQAVLSIIWMSVRQKLCKVLQISPREEDDKLNSALAAQEQMRGQATLISAGSPPGTDPGTGTGIITSSPINVLALVESCERAVNRKDLSDEELRELVAACDKISEQADSLLTTTRSD
jgi:hypothetical protein